MSYRILVAATVWIVSLQGSFANEFFSDIAFETTDSSRLDGNPQAKTFNLSTPEKDRRFQFKITSQTGQFTGPGFDPYYDAPAFTNFDSVAKQDGLDSFQAGNCFGFSVMAKLWFHDRSQDLSEWKLEDLEKLDVLDGSQYLGKKLLEQDGSFLSECKEKDECRLGKISKKPEFKELVRQAVMFHQTTQDKFPKDSPKWNTDNPEKLATDMQKLKSDLEAQGPLLFFYDVFSKDDFFEGEDRNWEEDSEAENQDSPIPRESGVEESSENTEEYEDPTEVEWGRYLAGHSMLLYRIKEVKATTKSGEEDAWRIDIYDNNDAYFKEHLTGTEEAYGTYLMYFPSLGKLTFSDHMKGESSATPNGEGGFVQKDLPFLDNKQTKVGITPFDPEGSVRNQIKASISHIEDARMASGPGSEFFETLEFLKTCADVNSFRRKLDETEKFDAWFRKNQSVLEAKWIQNKAEELFDQLENEPSEEEEQAIIDSATAEIRANPCRLN